jgi:hypothetical protein
VQHDPLNRLTTRVDGVGTTLYGLPREMTKQGDDYDEIDGG